MTSRTNELGLDEYIHDFSLLEEGGCLWTVNQRLESFLKTQWHTQKSSKNGSCSAFPTPDIHCLKTAITHLWCTYEENPLAEAPLLLHSNQCQFLWEQIIRSNQPSDLSWHNVEKTATLASHTWDLLQEWCLELDAITSPRDENWNTFKNWAKQFEQQCSEKGYLPQAKMLNLLTEGVRTKTVNLPHKIALAGFDSFSPQLQNFLETAKASGVSLYNFSLPSKTHTHHTCWTFPNQRTELEQMRLWAENKLADNPNASIGCVIPDLQTQRRAIMSTFSASTRTKDYNLSLGLALSDYPPIRAAFDLIQLEAPFDFQKISIMLRSPFIKNAHRNVAQYHKLDVSLRRFGAITLTEQKLEMLAKEAQCDTFVKALHKWCTTSPSHSVQKFPSEWTQVFYQKLQDFGWPGDIPLSSETYQLIRRFHELLDEMAGFDFLSGTMSEQSAFTLLQQLANNTVFQAQKNTQANIQILGLLEASNLQFDYLWIAGLHEETLPAKIQFNPFIPVSIQKKYNMPHSTTARQLDFSRKIFRRLLENSSEITVSMPEQKEQLPIAPSPLLQEFSLFPEVFTYPKHSPQKISLFSTDHTENVEDEFHLPVHTTVLNHIKGGSSILKEQALCPFRAFSKFRLHAKPLHQTQLGLNAMCWGNLVHKALETLWKELKTQEKLKSYTERDRDQLISKHVSEAFQSEEKELPLTEQQKLLEQERLITLLQTFLQKEIERPQTFEVLACEEKIEFELEGLHLKLRIDRVDSIESPTKKKVLIDYKTGNISTDSLLHDRPYEPQLFIYAAAYQKELKEVSGLLFIQLKNDNQKNFGLWDDDLDLGRKSPEAKKDSFENHLQNGLDEIKKLAEEFKNGRIEIDPHPRKKPCEQCDYKALCRINEQKALEQ